jgi:hypothetical protein
MALVWVPNTLGSYFSLDVGSSSTLSSRTCEFSLRVPTRRQKILPDWFSSASREERQIPGVCSQSSLMIRSPSSLGCRHYCQTETSLGSASGTWSITIWAFSFLFSFPPDWYNLPTIMWDVRMPVYSPTYIREFRKSSPHVLNSQQQS